MKIVPGNAQHIGSRHEQQDAFDFSDAQEERFAAHGGMIAVLADGMGGLAMGAEASRKAVDTALMVYGAKTPEESVDQALARAVQAANKAVCDMAEAADRLGDVGTTIVAVVIHQGKLHWISVGDSRLYLYRDGRVWQMSEDHDYARELDRDAAKGLVSPDLAKNHPDRNALVSFLGLDDLTLIDKSVRPFPLRVGDRVILCSDGVYGPLRQEELAVPLAGDPQEAAVDLIKAVLAKRLTHQDNCTVAVFAVEPDNTRLQGVTGVPGESLTLQLDRDSLPAPQPDRTLRLSGDSHPDHDEVLVASPRKGRAVLWITLALLSALAVVAVLALVFGARIFFDSRDAPPPEAPGLGAPAQEFEDVPVQEPEEAPADLGPGGQEEQGAEDQGGTEQEGPDQSGMDNGGMDQGGTPPPGELAPDGFGDQPGQNLEPEHAPDFLPDKGSEQPGQEALPAPSQGSDATPSPGLDDPSQSSGLEGATAPTGADSATPGDTEPAGQAGLGEEPVRPADNATNPPEQGTEASGEGNATPGAGGGPALLPDNAVEPEALPAQPGDDLAPPAGSAPPGPVPGDTPQASPEDNKDKEQFQLDDPVDPGEQSVEPEEDGGEARESTMPQHRELEI